MALWKDIWSGQEPLRQAFWNYTVCVKLKTPLTELWTVQGWNLHFRRNLNDWEMTSIAELQETIPQIISLTEERGILIWKVDSEGVFTVRSVYKDLTTAMPR